MNILIDWNPVTVCFKKLFSSFSFAADIADYLKQLVSPVTVSQNLQKYFFCIGSVSITLHTLWHLRKIFKTWDWALTHFKNKNNVTK